MFCVNTVKNVFADQDVAFYSDERAKIAKEDIESVLTNDSIVYVYRLVVFMQNVIEQLRDISVEDNCIRYEFFGPAMVM